MNRRRIATKDLFRVRWSVAEPIDCACGTGHNLRVIRIDPVRLDVLELGQAAEIGQRRGIVKQKLVRYDVGRFLPRDSEVSIGLEVAFVFRGEFYSLIDALGIVGRIECAGDPKAGFSRSGGDQLDHRHAARKRPGSAIL